MISHYVRAKFRVKIKSLAEEAKIIRAEEKKALRPFIYRRRLKHSGARFVGDLSIEESISSINAVIAKTGDDRQMTASGLHNHRVGVLRDEARATYLAYAFVRGMPWAKCGRGSKDVNFKRVFEIVRSLSGMEVTPASIVDWSSKEILAK